MGKRYDYIWTNATGAPTPPASAAGASGVNSDTGAEGTWDGDSWNYPAGSSGAGINSYLTAATAIGFSAYKVPPTNPAWQAILTGTSGALSATVNVYASNDQVHDTLVGTITLSVASWASTADDDVVELIPGSFGSWGYVRHELAAISGAGASVTTMGG